MKTTIPSQTSEMTTVDALWVTHTRPDKSCPQGTYRTSSGRTG